MFGQLDILILIELPNGMAREGGGQEGRGHGGAGENVSPLLSPWGLLALLLRQELASRWTGFATARSRNPGSLGEQIFSLCVSSFPPSQSNLYQLQRKQSRNSTMRRG